MPDHAIIDVGYFVGRQSAKIWLISNEDLEKMYQKREVGSEIALWCDVQPLDETEEHEDKWKRKHPEPYPSKCQDREDEVDTIYRELIGKLRNTYDTPQLRLWARMIHCGMMIMMTQPVWQ